MSIRATIVPAPSFVGRITATGQLKGELKGIIVQYMPATTDTDLVLTADGPEKFDPISFQNIIYLPSATKRYRLFTLTGPLFPGIHYTKSGNQITLLTGDISADDKFLLCEY